MNFSKRLLPYLQSATRVLAIVLVLGSVIGEMADTNLRVEQQTAVRSLDQSALASLFNPTQRGAEQARPYQTMPLFRSHLASIQTFWTRSNVLKESPLGVSLSVSLLNVSCLFRI